MSRHQARLDYAGCPLSVETSDESDLEWLLEFLLPDYDTLPGTRPPDVSLVRDGEAFDRLAAAGAHASRALVPCFSLDGRMEMLPRWTAPEDAGPEHAIVVFDDRAGAFLRFDRATGCVVIVARPGVPRARTALLRAVREETSARVSGRGGLVLHGAALALASIGIVIAGAKGAGKTTLLLHLLTAGGARLIANDRAALRLAGAVLHVRGMPTIVSVRGASLPWLPHLRERFRACRDHHRLTLTEARMLEGAAQGGVDRESWSLTPAQLARLLDVDRSPEVRLAAVLLPRHTGRDDGASACVLARGEAERRLERVVFTSGTAPRIDPSLWRALVETVPCIECALGTDAYQEGQASRVLDAIRAGAAER